MKEAERAGGGKLRDEFLLKVEEAGVLTVGGHTVRDPEVKFGLSVTGDVAPEGLWSNRTARPGQALVLTNALGTGVIGQAIRKGKASEAATKAALTAMTTLNMVGARIGRTHRATAATDVTGFGLLGHLRNIVRGSPVGATIELDALPLLPDAKAYHGFKDDLLACAELDSTNVIPFYSGNILKVLK